MKNIEKFENERLRLEVVEKRLKELHRYIIEDIVDDTLHVNKPWNFEECSIKLFKSWLKFYNNMRIMRGMEKLSGSYYFWHCLK